MQAASVATPETRSEVLRALVGGAVASWDGDAVRLRVAYSFGAPTLALTPSTDIRVSTRLLDESH